MTAATRDRATELTAARVPFVRATVVRAQVPTSACPGDDAIVLADGTVEGFVGGQCAEGSVRTAALDVLAGGEALLLRVLPEDSAGFPDSPGARVVVNPCLSGGAVEIFLEPVLPPPVVEVVGDSPVAHAVEALAAVLGWTTRRSLPDAAPDPAAVVVVASHGRDEHRSVRAALDAGVAHVAVVASPRRGAALLDELGLDAAERLRVRTPAGLDLGARTPPEIALSILAEVVPVVRSRPVPVAAAPRHELDPVCGMTVAVTPATPTWGEDGDRTWFCGTGCRDAHAALQAAR